LTEVGHFLLTVSMHFYVPLNRAPQAVVETVRRLPGVEAAEGRSIASVRIPVPPGVRLEAARLLEGHVHSLPASGHPTVDDLAIDEGRTLQAASGEVLMETRFARAHGYSPGMRVHLVSGDRITAVDLVGLVSSPEFLWVSKSSSDPRPSATFSGILYARLGDVERLQQGPGLCEVHVRTRPGAEVEAVMRATGRALEPWRDGEPAGRMRVGSYVALELNRYALSLLAALFSTAFAVLGSITLASALKCLLLAERRSLGILAALGLGPAELVRPWIAAGAGIGALGASLGALAGMPLGAALTRLYTQTLGLPFVRAEQHLGLALATVGALVVVAAVASWWSLQQELRTSPAGLLSPAVWAEGRTTPFEGRWPALRRLPLRLRLPVRTLWRHPARTLLLVLGSSFAIMQATLVLTLLDSQQHIVAAMLEQTNRWSFYATLRSTMTPSSVPPIAQWPGVVRAEQALRLVTVVGALERAHEIALLQALGMTRAAIAGQWLGETLLVGCAALPPGMGLGLLAARTALHTYRNLIVDLPLVVQPATLVVVAGASLLLLAAATLPTLRRVAAQPLCETLDTP
jgi:putative ABC transport system permease protein